MSFGDSEFFLEYSTFLFLFGSVIIMVVYMGVCCICKSCQDISVMYPGEWGYVCESCIKKYVHLHRR